MNQPTATTRATPSDDARATVRLLAGQGLSNRAIARHVRVSETTIRRWRKADAPAAHDDALTINLDADLRDHLAVLASAGLDPQAGIMLAVQLLASAYESAWTYGDAPTGTRPRIQSHAVGAPTATCRPFPLAAKGTDQLR